VRTPQTVDAVFVRAAARDAAATHLVLPDGATVDYGETLARARRLAGALVAAGIGPGDRVAAFMRTSRELYETYVACGLAGAVAVPVNGLNAARENRGLLADCTPAALLVEAAMLDRVPDEILPGSLRLRGCSHVLRSSGGSVPARGRSHTSRSASCCGTATSCSSRSPACSP